MSDPIPEQDTPTDDGGMKEIISGIMTTLAKLAVSDQVLAEQGDRQRQILSDTASALQKMANIQEMLAAKIIRLENAVSGMKRPTP